ncbi:MAG: tripartite tricarboxylate transporter substrate binding protein [Acetobacterales bacterium]
MRIAFRGALAGALLLGAVGLTAPSTAEAAYPEKSITFVVPFAAGGGTDRWARGMAAVSEKHFGQMFKVVNVPGAQGITGWRHLLAQPADGYTFMMGSSTLNLALAVNPNPALKHSDIKVATIISAFPVLMLVKPGSEWSTFEGLKKYAAANPNKLVVGGTLSNLIGVADFVKQAGIQVRLVPYNSSSDATTDFLGGHIHAYGSPPAAAQPLVPEKATPVFVTNDEPVDLAGFENVPTSKSLGFESMTMPRWIGMHPDTPDDIVNGFVKRLDTLMNDPAVMEPLLKTGEEVYVLPRAEAERRYERMVVQLTEASKLLQK